VMPPVFAVSPLICPASGRNFCWGGLVQGTKS
jgi:hypothetical protein